MCMTLAFVWPQGGIVATCTRYTLLAKDGTTPKIDAGGKIVRTPTGWAVTSGELVTMLTGLRVLEHTEGEKARAGIRQVHSRIASTYRAHKFADPAKSCFLSLRSIEGKYGIEAIYPNGDGIEWSPNRRVMVTWPAKMDAEAKGTLLGLHEGRPRGESQVLARVQKLDQLVRVIASWFAFAAERDSSMAPTMEIGLIASGHTLYARGSASEIANDPHCLGRFTPPPNRPGFPHAEAESLFFGSAHRPGLFTIDPRFPTYCLEAAA